MAHAYISKVMGLIAIVTLVSVSATTMADNRNQSNSSPGQAQVANRIAQHSDFSVGQLQELRAEGLGWGDVEIATILSERTGAPLSHLAELWYTADESWEIVASEYGIEELGQLISERKRRIGRSEDD